MKIENPVKRIYIKVISHSPRFTRYEVRMVFETGSFVKRIGQGWTPDKSYDVRITEFPYDYQAEMLRDRLLEKFGITVITKINKLETITFANMVIQE